jgi:hypothetical protein
MIVAQPRGCGVNALVSRDHKLIMATACGCSMGSATADKSDGPAGCRGLRRGASRSLPHPHDLHLRVEQDDAPPGLELVAA